MMSVPAPPIIRIDTVDLLKFHTTADVLRLDLIHPVISGNKWFKLKEYINEAIASGKKNIVTFGGAYSNHIVATAAAARDAGLKSAGVIRGEKPDLLSPTLNDAVNFGMRLYFVSREEYKKAMIPGEVFTDFHPGETCIINEGGYGKQGAEGAKSILQTVDAGYYSHIVTAAGTGTTLAGLMMGSQAKTEMIGVSVLKNNFSLATMIADLLGDAGKAGYNLVHDYHFGGYAKYNESLIGFMNEWFKKTGIPSDFVYTAKLFFAVNDLAEKGFFGSDPKLLVIHSGGLQGNRSLPKGKLIF